MSTSHISPKNVLMRLGFKPNEALTYSALLELGPVSIRAVADHTGINRGTTYEAIKGLLAEGLVRVRQNGKREQYVAESPERINDIIREKRKDLLQIQQESQELIPLLLARSAMPIGEPLFRYYQDDEGMAAILRDVLQTCGRLKVPQYCAYSSPLLKHYIYRKFPKFTERRIQEGIFVKTIAVGGGGDPAELSERRSLEEPSDSSASSYVMIYGNKVVFMSLSKDLTPYGVVIEDAGNATMQRLLFDRLWDGLPKIA